MDVRSYAAAIAQTVSQKATPIKSDEFETFLTELLRSVNTYVGPKDETGEREIHFHPPFSIEYPELMQGEEARRVCFDPSVNVDSEHVEYLGFGHPVIDRLVQAIIEEKHDGAAAYRRMAPGIHPRLSAGWQFNWRVRIDGIRPKEFILPVFVGKDGLADREVGEALLANSRRFGPESLAGTPGCATLLDAHELAQAYAFDRRDEELAEYQREAADRTRVEEERTRALYDRRLIAGSDRVSACKTTLEKMYAADEASRRAVIPLWEANLRRAEAEVAVLRDDLERDLIELERRRIPSGEVKLLNIARVELELPGASDG